MTSDEEIASLRRGLRDVIDEDDPHFLPRPVDESSEEDEVDTENEVVTEDEVGVLPIVPANNVRKPFVWGRRRNWPCVIAAKARIAFLLANPNSNPAFISTKKWKREPGRPRNDYSNPNKVSLKGWN